MPFPNRWKSLSLKGGESELFQQQSREANVFLAKVAEQAERYEEMVEAMRSIAKLGVELTSDERSLLSVAYKNVVGSRRASWKIISSMDQKETAASIKVLIQQYLAKVEKELSEVCRDIIELLDVYLIPTAVDPEAKVFYLKMAGDYWRYLAEVAAGPRREEAAGQAVAAYRQAHALALEHLPPTHPVRLGLALNYSVFYYEILSQPEEACALAKKAFDEAISDLDALSEDSYKDATLIMQLLRDNLTLWTVSAPPAPA